MRLHMRRRPDRRRCGPCRRKRATGRRSQQQERQIRTQAPCRPARDPQGREERDVLRAPDSDRDHAGSSRSPAPGFGGGGFIGGFFGGSGGGGSSGGSVVISSTSSSTGGISSSTSSTTGGV